MDSKIKMFFFCDSCCRCCCWNSLSPKVYWNWKVYWNLNWNVSNPWFTMGGVVARYFLSNKNKNCKHLLLFFFIEKYLILTSQITHVVIIIVVVVVVILLLSLLLYLKKSIDPPPAATVLMSSCGAWMVTPAVVVSKTWSNEPANRLTSVEVPPMSNPMIGFGLTPWKCFNFFINKDKRYSGNVVTCNNFTSLVCCTGRYAGIVCNDHSARTLLIKCNEKED